MPEDDEVRAIYGNIQLDITRANTYRLELDKIMLTISTAILAFTVSFRPTLQIVDSEYLMWISWIALATSILSGIGELFGWEVFYISYRNHDWPDAKEWAKNPPPRPAFRSLKGNKRRKKITTIRRVFRVSQLITLAVGVSAASAFSALNIHNVIAKTNPASIERNSTYSCCN